MTFTIITVGSHPGPEIKSLIQSYLGRLPKHIKANWVYVKHGQGDQISSISREAESILKAIPKKNKIFLLDEAGKQFSSPELSSKLYNNPQNTTIIIGGAYGVDNSIKHVADVTWSLGKMVFPHQLVRLILSEQLYRAHTINVGHPYHHS